MDAAQLGSTTSTLGFVSPFCALLAPQRKSAQTYARRTRRARRSRLSPAERPPWAPPRCPTRDHGVCAESRAPFALQRPKLSENQAFGTYGRRARCARSAPQIRRPSRLSPTERPPWAPLRCPTWDHGVCAESLAPFALQRPKLSENQAFGTYERRARCARSAPQIPHAPVVWSVVSGPLVLRPRPAVCLCLSPRLVASPPRRRWPGRRDGSSTGPRWRDGSTGRDGRAAAAGEAERRQAEEVATKIAQSHEGVSAR